MRLLIAILIFIALMVITYLVLHISNRKMTKGTLAALVILNIFLSGLGGIFSVPITNGIEEIMNQAESVYVENKYISLTPYNRGYYTGYMLNDLPHGEGTLVYLDDNENRYSITIGGITYNALRYEGHFKEGWRDGKGIVYYEGGYREEGTYYGQWAPGNVVFRGKIWDGNKRYVEVKIYSQNGVESWIDSEEGWVEVR